MAKRHSQTQSLDNNEETSVDSPVSVSEVSSSIPSADVSPASETQPSLDSASPKAIPEINLDSVAEYIKGLTDSERVRLGGRLRESGVIKSTSPSDGIVYPDGSMDIVVRLDSPVVEQLKIWAEGEGGTLGDQARLRINEAISSYIYGDWGATQVKPEASKPAVGEPAAAAGATK